MVSALCTVEVVVVQCIEVGEEKNTLAVEAVSCNIPVLVGELDNSVVVVSWNSKGQGVEEKIVAVVVEVNGEVVVVVFRCSKPVLEVEMTEGVEKSILMAAKVVVEENIQEGEEVVVVVMERRINRRWGGVV